VTDNTVDNTVDALARRVVETFEAARDPVAAAGMSRYLRDQFPFLGIASVPRVALLRQAVHGSARPTEQEVRDFCLTLWARPEREYQYAAQWYARRHVRVLGPGFLPTARELLVTKSWWDTVDELAQNVVGDIVHRHRDLGAEMDRWIGDEDLWLRRSAILHQNRWKADTDAEVLFRYCRRCAPEREFFIRKAIGWALREYSKTDGAAVRRFVADHQDELSNLSQTEALKCLDRAARGGRVAG